MPHPMCSTSPSGHLTHDRCPYYTSTARHTSDLPPCSKQHVQWTALPQAALFAITTAAEVVSKCIEGSEGADEPADEAAAGSVADSLLQLLLHLAAATASLAHSREQIRLLELLLMQTLAPALMHHLADHEAQAQAQVSLMILEHTLVWFLNDMQAASSS